MKTAEQIEREVAEHIRQEAPHADPILVMALMARLREQLKKRDAAPPSR